MMHANRLINLRLAYEDNKYMRILMKGFLSSDYIDFQF